MDFAQSGEGCLSERNNLRPLARRAVLLFGIVAACCNSSKLGQEVVSIDITSIYGYQGRPRSARWEDFQC